MVLLFLFETRTIIFCIFGELAWLVACYQCPVISTAPFCVAGISLFSYFVGFQIFINVPWYFSVLYSMFSPFLTQRTKSKFVISKEGNAAETLYK